MIARNIPAKIRFFLVVLACSAAHARSVYDIEKAAAYATSNCASGSDLCAEFVFRALQAGGLFPGHAPIKRVVDLIPFLTSNGWSGGPPGSNSCSRGDVIVYAEAQKGPLAHVALAKGDGYTWQHNKNSCNTYAKWSVSKGEMQYNRCWSPPNAASAPAPAPKPASSPKASPSFSSATDAAVGKDCKAGSWGKGTCKDVKTCTGSSTSYRGFCPGPDHVRCCVPNADYSAPAADPEASSSSSDAEYYAPATDDAVGKDCKAGYWGKGTCKAADACDGSSTSYRGFCPGGDNIRCCVPNVASRLKGFLLCKKTPGEDPSKLPFYCRDGFTPNKARRSSGDSAPAKKKAFSPSSPCASAAAAGSLRALSAGCPEDFERKIFPWLILWEGGYSNDPADTGGSTMYGISFNGDKANLAQFGITSGSQMRQLTLDQAETIYLRKYWNPVAAGACLG